MTWLWVERNVNPEFSLIDSARVGITLITAIRFATESSATYDALRLEIARTPEMAQCYTVAGEEDFILIYHFTDVVSYGDWINSRILTNPAISCSTTHVVYRGVKFETAVPV